MPPSTPLTGRAEPNHAPARIPTFAEDLGRALDALRAGRVDIPVIQPAEPFLDMAGEDLRRRIFLTESETGESLCLRPEFTIPVCRAHIAENVGTPRRYSYLGKVFRQRRDGANEFFQAGVEDLGEPDEAHADARASPTPVRWSPDLHA
jgi:ATP phosphoribosyltransferase regulatory subunit